MLHYAVIIEPSSTGFGAYAPDLPSCIAVGESEAEVRDLIREAIVFHLDGLREDGSDIPLPATRVEYTEVQNAV
jgi:predicted RNase H-like HicB family nuclease